MVAYLACFILLLSKGESSSTNNLNAWSVLKYIFCSRFLIVCIIRPTNACISVADDAKVFCWGWNKYGQVKYVNLEIAFSYYYFVIQICVYLLLVKCASSGKKTVLSFFLRHSLLEAAWLGWCHRPQHSFWGTIGWSGSKEYIMWLVAHSSPSWSSHLSVSSSLTDRGSFVRLD